MPAIEPAGTRSRAGGVAECPAAPRGLACRREAAGRTGRAYPPHTAPSTPFRTGLSLEREGAPPRGRSLTSFEVTGDAGRTEGGTTAGAIALGRLGWQGSSK